MNKIIQFHINHGDVGRPRDAKIRLKLHGVDKLNDLIKKAADMVNGQVLDVTWYLTQVVITVNNETLDQVEEYTMGPNIVRLGAR